MFAGVLLLGGLVSIGVGTALYITLPWSASGWVCADQAGRLLADLWQR